MIWVIILFTFLVIQCIKFVIFGWIKLFAFPLTLAVPFVYVILLFTFSNMHLSYYVHPYFVEKQSRENHSN